MTTDQFIKSQEKKLELILKQNIPLQRAVHSVMSMQSKRIFLLGQNARNAPIGTYKATPKGIYISGAKDKTPKQFTKKGKPETGRKLKSADRKTGWFPSYLAYKKAIGRNRNVQTVDLLLWGHLSQNWANAKNVAAAKPIKLNANSYIVAISEHNANKVARYGNVFGLSKQEREMFMKVLKVELNKALS